MPMYLKMTIERVAGISACTGKGWFEALVNFGSCGQKPLHVGGGCSFWCGAWWLAA